MLFLLFILGLIINSHAGADLAEYIQWADAAQSGDIFRIESAVQSPLGVPLTQWAHGTGFLIAIPLWLVRTISFNQLSLTPHSLEMWAFGCGIVAALLCWWALFTLIRRTLPSDSSALSSVLAFFPIAFLGTHLGYYSSASSSEIFSCTVLALLNLCALTANPARMRSAVAVGILGAMLITVRPYLGVFSLLAAVVFIYRYRNIQPAATLRMCMTMCVPILALWGVAVIQTGLINHWMTGSFLQSAYSFGNEHFKSLDFTRPMTIPMLFHPLHGLFIYHPLYALGIAATIRLLLCSESSKELRLVLGGVLCSVFLLLVVLSAWYCWWLGEDTFGMRGMAVGSVVFVPILMVLLARLRLRKVEWLIWWGSVQICMLWSGLLYWRWASIYYTFDDLIKDQSRMLFSPLVVFVMLSIASSLAILRLLKKMNIIDRQSPFLMTNQVTAAWFGFSSFILLKTTITDFIGFDKPGTCMMVACMFASVVTLLSGLAIHKGDSLFSPTESNTLPTSRAFEWTTIVVFILFCGLFFRLAVTTEKTITSGSAAPNRYEYVAPFHVTEVVRTYEEYKKIDGFDQEKARLKTFLDAALLTHRALQ